jgi:hypothetical protein
MRTVPPVCPNKITDLEVKELAIRFTEALIKSWDFKVSVNTKQFAEWGLTIALHLQDKYNQRLNDNPGT